MHPFLQSFMFNPFVIHSYKTLPLQSFTWNPSFSHSHAGLSVIHMNVSLLSVIRMQLYTFNIHISCERHMNMLKYLCCSPDTWKSRAKFIIFWVPLVVEVAVTHKGQWFMYLYVKPYRVYNVVGGIKAAGGTVYDTVDFAPWLSCCRPDQTKV